MSCDAGVLETADEESQDSNSRDISEQENSAAEGLLGLSDAGTFSHFISSISVLY